MNRWLALTLATILIAQPCLLFAEVTAPGSTADTRLYLDDGTVVMGRLIEKSDDLFIMMIDDEIFTFERGSVNKYVTLESLGSTAKTINVTEFPYISFLGGTVTFGILSTLFLGRASDKDAAADENETFANDTNETLVRNNLLIEAARLRDDADTARKLGWGTAVLAVGTLGVALIPRKTTRRVFPELTFEQGVSRVNVTYRF